MRGRLNHTKSKVWLEILLKDMDICKVLHQA